MRGGPWREACICARVGSSERPRPSERDVVHLKPVAQKSSLAETNVGFGWFGGGRTIVCSTVGQTRVDHFGVARTVG